MAFAAFERLPRRLGWKHEYYGGKAHVRPAWLTVAFRLELASRPVRRRAGIRPLLPSDATALEDPFLAAFARAPEYAGYPAERFRQSAATYLAGFFGTVRGDCSPVSLVAEVKGTILGAALVKTRPSGPLLDCLYVRPEYARRGLATAMTARLVNSLLELGETHLLSYVMLANEPSLAWHHHFGFREVPDLWVASYRWHYYLAEVARHRELNDLPGAEVAKLAEKAATWADEVERLEALRKQDPPPVYPLFD
jgi:ribosomal protein S18 acetylase RimI-like enzyme